MPSTARQKPWPELGRSPEGLTSRAREHLATLCTHLSPSSHRGRFIVLRLFLEWCAAQELTQPNALTVLVLERYRRHVQARRTRSGAPVSASHKLQLWHAVRMFCRWLTRHGYVEHNLVASLERMAAPKREPQPVLSVSEVEVVLSQPDLTTPKGVRDRAILEVLYSTGLRRTELVRLEMNDLNAEAGTLLVREGKGKRDRLVPIGSRALEWVQCYLREARAEWVKKRPEERRIFLGKRGQGLGADGLSSAMRAYLTAAGVTKPGSCHLLRRTMATEMLSNGADVRVIQQILGHANLDTTMLYTRVSFEALKRVCERTHPGSERLSVHASVRPENSLEYLSSLAAIAAEDAATAEASGFAAKKSGRGGANDDSDRKRH